MPARAVLLLSDGEFRSAAAAVLESLGVKAQPCADPAKLAELLKQDKTQLLLFTEKIGGKPADELIAGIAKVEPKPAIVVGLEKHSMGRALELMNAGAWECAQPSILESDLEKIFRKGIERAEAEPVRFPPRVPFWRKRKFIGIAAALLFFAAAGGAVKFRLDQKARERAALEEYRSEKQYPLPYSHPAALAIQDGHFWIADWYAQSVYQHDPEPQGFVMLSVYHFADLQPVAIAWENKKLWVLSAAHRMNQYEAGQKLRLIRSARAPGNNPSGMAFDGKNLWTADAGTKKIYRHAMDKTMAVEEEFAYPGTPLSLFWDGSSLWSLDGDQNRMLRHAVKNNQLTTEKYVTLEGPAGKRVGAAYDGERFWTLAEKPAAIVRQAIPDGSMPAGRPSGGN